MTFKAFYDILFVKYVSVVLSAFAGLTKGIEYDSIVQRIMENVD